MKSAYIHTLGCPKNTADSDALRRMLLEKGFTVNDPYGDDDHLIEQSDVILINTCAFTGDAKKQSINEILRLSVYKNNGKKLLVFGCLAQRYKEELKAELPEIDALYGVGEEEKIAGYLRGLRPRTPTGGGTASCDIGLRPHPYESAGGLPYAYIKIAEGCNRSCAYCIIPSIRGPLKSRPPEEILREAEALVKSGKKELILVAQDLTSYGANGYKVHDLVRDMASISGDFRLRLLYLYPIGITDPLIDVIADEEKLCKYLDIPLQHSEDRLLKAMGRVGSKDSHRGLIKKLRAAIPGVTLRSTFIVGFPGETEEDFKALKDFVSETGFERLGVFRYSKEEGTPSARMRGQIRESVKRQRLDELMRLQAEISLRKNKALAGKKVKVLMDESGVGRLPSQAPEIDGVVIIRNHEGIPGGTFIEAKITRAYDYDLEAEPWTKKKT